MGHTYKGVGR